MNYQLDLFRVQIPPCGRSGMAFCEVERSSEGTTARRAIASPLPGGCDDPEQLEISRAMRGNQVAPIVKLDSRGMKTSFGVKQSPEFTIQEWRDLASSGPSTLQIEHQPEPVVAAAAATTTEPAAKQAPAAGKQKKVGRPVKPVTIQEELNDDLPNHLKAG